MKDGPNGRLLGTIAADAGWCLTISETPSAMSFRPGSDVPAIVIFDRRLSPERWTCVVELLAQNSPRPYVILLSPSMDANLWDEVERVGGSDILRDPIDHDRLIETLERAWRVWLSQQQVRNPPAGR
jgi:FixJ family two-component response regulator